MNRSSLTSNVWLIVALLWIVACLNYLDRMMITTMRVSLIEAVPMTDAQFGLLTSAFLWVYGALSPLAGYLADRVGRSRVIVLSLFVWSAVTWLTGRAETFEQLLAARALMGVSEACYIPAALALIADAHGSATRSLATGIHMTGIFVGSALGGLGGILAERYGWSTPFTYFGAFGMFYAVLLAFAFRRVSPPDTATSEHGASSIAFGEALQSLLSRGSFWVLAVYWGLLGVAGWVIGAWMPTYLNEEFHLSQGAAGISATGYLQAAALVGVLFGGAWADRWSRTNRRGPILVPALGLCLAAPGILLAASSTWLYGAILGLTIYGFTRTFADANMMPILCLVSDERYRATGYGILNLVSSLVGGVGVYAGGALRDRDVGLTSIFLFVGLLLVVCAMLLSLVRLAGTDLRSDAALTPVTAD
ncbi:MAG TPA: MFS transporter [Pirellulales bacterium]|nr:MFS transporter [Pirellulales bacterium]